MKKIPRDGRINFIMKILAKAKEEGKEVSEKRFVAEMCLNMNASERSIREYLKILELTEKILRKEGIISIK